MSETMTETATAVRTVTVYSTQGRGESQVIETDASTWGELKSQIDFSTGNVKAVVRENRTTLEANDAMLPNQDCTVFLYPSKVKSGQDVFENMTLTQLRREVKKRKTMSTTSDKPNVLRKKLRDYELRHGTTETVEQVVEPTTTLTSKQERLLERQNEALTNVVLNLRKAFDKAFDDMLRGIETGVTDVALKNDAEAVAREIGGLSEDTYYSEDSEY